MTSNQIISLIRSEYDRLDRMTGTDTSGVEIKVSSRLTSRFGYFSARKKNAFAKPELSITIASRIAGDEALFYDVIRHEYAHAVCYLREPRVNHGHDAVWKKVCREVGCIAKATRPADDNALITKRLDKYIVRCRSCGAESRYKVESKVVKLAEGKIHGKIRCSRCGGDKFTLIRLDGSKL